MRQEKPQFLEIGNKKASRHIAYLHHKGREPGLIWLPGFHSSMQSTKATALADWCAEKDASLARFDYFGHGQSDGTPEEGTLSIWLDDARTIFRTLTQGPQILVGSSMGAWVALLLLRKLIEDEENEAARIAGLVLIAPAWDMTQKVIWPRLDESAKEAIMTEGIYRTPSGYGDGPYPITRTLMEDGRKHLLQEKPFSPRVPIRILHGMQDADVRWRNSLELLDLMDCDDAILTLIKDGDHRLSRPQDIERLKREIFCLRENIS